MAHDGLLAYRRVGGIAGGKLVGNLAIRVPRPTDDARSYVFQLRDGIRYSDGSRVRAADVRYSLERTLTINPDGAPFLSEIVGAPSCHPQGHARCDLSRGMAIDNDARTVTIRLRASDPDFVHWLTVAAADVVPEGTPGRIELSGTLAPQAA